MKQNEITQMSPEQIAQMYPFEMKDGFPRLSYSALKAFIQSPAHFIAYKEKKDEEIKAAFKFGRMFHHNELQPEVFKEKYTLIPEDAPIRPRKMQLEANYMSENYYTLPETAPKRPTDKQMSGACMTSAKPADIEKAKGYREAREWHDKFAKENEGKVFLSASDLLKREELNKAVKWWDDFDATGKEVIYPMELELLEGMKRGINGDEEAFILIRNGTEFEKELMFQDKETGIWMKVIIDIYNSKKKKATELKSTTCADPDIFKFEIKKYNYPGQGAIYIDALKANKLPVDENLFQIIAVEKKIPHGCSVNDISIHAINKGRYDYKQELKNFKNWWTDVFLKGKPIKSYAYKAPVTGTFLYDIHESERVK